MVSNPANPVILLSGKTRLVSYLFACIAVSYECESFLLAWT